MIIENKDLLRSEIENLELRSEERMKRRVNCFVSSSTQVNILFSSTSLLSFRVLNKLSTNI